MKLLAIFKFRYPGWYDNPIREIAYRLTGESLLGPEYWTWGIRYHGEQDRLWVAGLGQSWKDYDYFNWRVFSFRWTFWDPYYLIFDPWD